MTERGFAGRDAWLAAVETALARPGARSILIDKGLDADTVRRVAGVEVSHASAHGISYLTAEQLAEATGLARSAVLRARLALVELELADVAMQPCAQAAVFRELHHQ